MAWKVIAGNALSASLVSWRHTTSGSTSSSHDSTRNRRAFSELTFQVARRTRPTIAGADRRTIRAVEATCWSDYLCPWCYVGQDRSAQMEALGLTVVHRPYELHPEIPAAGRRVRPDGRMAPTFARIAAECDEIGLAFRAPTRMPNTRRALETAEWVRIHHPDAADGVHAGLFHAHFAAGLEIDDPDVVDAIVAAAGAPSGAVRAAVDDGLARSLVSASMDEARAAGVSSTPTWVLDDGFAIPGALDRATLERWITKIVARSSSAPTA